MRAFCTVSAPLEVCAPPTRPLLPGSRFLALRLLGIPQPRTLYFLVEAKSRVREVYAQTCLHFAKQGMLDTELFGLAVLIDGEYLFADPDSKLSKYGPKSWRSSHTHGLDANGRPLLELHFRVQFYIESPLMLRDETSRHNYYLQLKANAISRDVPKECSEQSLILLGGLALQADLGDCPEDRTAEYFRLEDYIPTSMRSSWGTTALQSCHREYRGMSRADAETHYIRETCALQEALNAHTFKMKLTKTESGTGSVWFIVYAKGIKVYGEDYVPTTFLWPNISKLSFERKKFEIRYGDNKTTLYSINDDKNKMLFSLCKETHQFSMKIATRLNEAIRREEEESSCLHACYMYSRSLNLPYKNKGDQRISVISSTSSNTTSGIVSDRVHSEDELEIMINSPPAVPIAAPSTESLALAHLLDRPSVSRQTSSVGRVSYNDLQDTLAALSVRSNGRSSSSESTPEQQQKHERNSKDSAESDSPNSQHNIGSQCSSTCSTIVVTAEATVLSSLAAPSTSTNSNSRRRPSNTSSLELGFSHTAQNSTLSEATTTSIDLDYASRENEDEENLSGVYTLAHATPTETSGVYTMSNSELTGQSSEIAESESHESSYYGSFQPKSEIDNESDVQNMDSVDGQFRKRVGSDTRDFRLRSDSNVSTSGSFRGDGSDPTDKKHVLLSAEELTDLIVGRGTYPSRKTVSNNLDSDCDYVTLPLPLEGDSYLQGNQDTAPTEDGFEEDPLPANPPAPPVRVDSNSHRFSMGNDTPALPPPYNARHETTGLCGPPVREEAPVIPLRDPPPYPQQPARQPPPVLPPLYQPPAAPSSNSSSVGIPEEAAARFITTRPQINILKAHTSVIGENPKPSFAAPTTNNCVPQQQQQSTAASSSHVAITSTIGIPIVPYHNIQRANANKSMSTLPTPPPPYPELKQTSSRACVILPVIKPRQYLPPPPPKLPRQPPPPPPPNFSTVYTSQLARSQIELFQQQLYSDVDYVIYPLQDPAVSQQEYLDAKQGSILAAMAQSPPPPPYLAYHHTGNHGTWDACKGHAIYRSTPYLSMAYSTHSQYASTQNLSDTYVQLPGAYSPMYSPSVASLCSSYEPPPPPPLRPRPLPTAIFSRSKSDDNILNSIETMPKYRRLPPPPPPPYDYRKPVKATQPFAPVIKAPPLPPATSKPPMPSPLSSSSLPRSSFFRSQQSLTATPIIESTVAQQMHTPYKHLPQTQKILNTNVNQQQHQPIIMQNKQTNSQPQLQHQVQQQVAQHLQQQQQQQQQQAQPPPPQQQQPQQQPAPQKQQTPTELQHQQDQKLLQQQKEQKQQQHLQNLIQQHQLQTQQLQAASPQQTIDINTLREKSKHLDLPLISALCNDRSLLKQTKAFVMPKHPRSSINQCAISSPKSKYPVSGLSTTQLAKPRKSSVSHRHPNDKLPPLPMQTTEGNNYVMDPTPTAIKHKSYNSQPNL